MSDRRTEDPPTDVLAAEEFVVPAPDPAFQPEDLRLPSDLVGGEQRDVLVAEEFAMPAPDEARVHRLGNVRRRGTAARVAALGVAPVLGLLWSIRRLRRRGSDS